MKVLVRHPDRLSGPRGVALGAQPSRQGMNSFALRGWPEKREQGY